jgi:hypothetical protein
MRTFLHTHWKSIVALIVLVLLAVLTLTPGNASADLAGRMRAHVRALAASDGNPAQPERAARHIEAALAADGYRVRRHVYSAGGRLVRSIEASLSNVAAHERPQRTFIIGARYQPGAGAPATNADGSAAVLELARLLKTMQPGRGTELKFVFFVHGEPGRQAAGSAARAAATLPDSGNFIAFVGPREASAPVRVALAAFRAPSKPPAQGLAAPAYVEGVTLSDAAPRRDGASTLLLADTAFLRYPCYRTQGQAGDNARDYPTMARVVNGLVRTIVALAGGART